MNTIQFIGINPADLIKGIQTALIPQLKAELSQEFQPKQPTEYLTRAEVCDGDMSKRWYVYFSYRNSQTGKMERQAPIYILMSIELKTLRSEKERLKH